MCSKENERGDYVLLWVLETSYSGPADLEKTAEYYATGILGYIVFREACIYGHLDSANRDEGYTFDHQGFGENLGEYLLDFEVLHQRVHLVRFYLFVDSELFQHASKDNVFLNGMGFACQFPYGTDLCVNNYTGRLVYSIHANNVDMDYLYLDLMGIYP